VKIGDYRVGWRSKQSKIWIILADFNLVLGPNEMNKRTWGNGSLIKEWLIQCNKIV
jgi:hypothetical protein